jgi:hypothetical protein
LRAVDISANLVSDEGAAALASLPHLRALSLSWSCVSDRTLEAVARGIPGLLVLRLRGNLLRRDGQAALGISSNGMRAFADAHHSLVDLDVRDCDLSIPSARALFPSLAVLDPRPCPRPAIASAMIGGCKSLFRDKSDSFTPCPRAGVQRQEARKIYISRPQFDASICPLGAFVFRSCTSSHSPMLFQAHCTSPAHISVSEA